MKKNIYVTQPSLPPLEELLPYLQKIWDKKVLTNGGEFHEQLEKALCDYLDVKYISLFSNGTIALLIALKALEIRGEVITTPYSFVATTNSLIWNGATPVFVDIEPYTLNLDPRKIEMAISPKTTAIMPVHCYGHPCDVEEIERIAHKYNLKVIYDAAHAFGVRCHCGSVLNHGNLSVLSFHATKVFNTFEGGAIVCADAETKYRIDQLKNFGFDINAPEVEVVSCGLNGKMSEFNAALGLLQLKHIDKDLEKRKEIDSAYREKLKAVKGIAYLNSGEIVSNYSYFPVLVQSDYPLKRNDLYQKLLDHGIYSRRYFYPLISQFPIYRDLPSANNDNLPVATLVAQQVLCLPIYSDLNLSIVSQICEIIAN
jgi:dTDP-4-amino-4,6-dideoxygalactose transaminase